MDSGVPIVIQPLTDRDQDWVRQFAQQHWASPTVVSRGKIYTLHTLPGFIACKRGEKIGLITYYIHADACEIVSIDSTLPRQGVGTALIDAVKQAVYQIGCKRLWLITTNDNLPALGFYQKRGFSLVAIHRNALEHRGSSSRKFL